MNEHVGDRTASNQEGKLNGRGHLSDWIAAYHDGELSGERRRRVSAHLQDCAQCRAELEALRRLSALLQADPLPDPQPARRAGLSRRFAARVVGRLPSPAARPAWGGLLAAGWQAFPLLLIGAWLLAQAGLTLAGVVALAGVSAAVSTGQLSAWGSPNALTGMLNLDRMGLFLAASPWLAPAALAGLWVMAYLGLALLFALLVWGWVAAWWVDPRRPGLR